MALVRHMSCIIFSYRASPGHWGIHEERGDTCLGHHYISSIWHHACHADQGSKLLHTWMNQSMAPTTRRETSTRVANINAYRVRSACKMQQIARREEPYPSKGVSHRWMEAWCLTGCRIWAARYQRSFKKSLNTDISLWNSVLPQRSQFFWSHFFYLFIYLFWSFCLFLGPLPVAYGGSQARGPVQAVATGLCQSHSNVGSEPLFWSIPQLTAMPDP